MGRVAGGQTCPGNGHWCGATSVFPNFKNFFPGDGVLEIYEIFTDGGVWELLLRAFFRNFSERNILEDMGWGVISSKIDE